MRTYNVTLTGETALLLHSDNLSWSERMKKWENDPDNAATSVKGDDRSPAWRWIGGVYVDQGKLVIPSDNLMSTLREAGAKCPTGKGRATFKSLTQSGLVVDQAAWPIIGAKGEVLYKDIEELLDETDFSKHEARCLDLGFELFAKRARVGQSKHVRVRARFNVWSISGTITVLTDDLPDAAFRRILEVAGERIGLCDWRPSSPRSPGSFGKFVSAVTTA